MIDLNELAPRLGNREIEARMLNAQHNQDEKALAQRKGSWLAGWAVGANDANHHRFLQNLQEREVRPKSLV